MIELIAYIVNEVSEVVGRFGFQASVFLSQAHCPQCTKDAHGGDDILGISNFDSEN